MIIMFKYHFHEGSVGRIWRLAPTVRLSRELDPNAETSTLTG